VAAGAAAYRVLLREGAARTQAQRDLTTAIGKLQDANEALRLRTRQSDLLREMAEMFQSCGSDEEGRAVMATYLPRLMPGTSGAVYRHNNSRNVVELVVAWGDAPPAEVLFAPEECWALRRGKTHKVDHSSAINCEHLGQIGGEAACLPMVAHGETIGVVTVLGGADVGDGAARWSSGIDQVALALANLALRERLSQMSLRDALTGLHNRRALEDVAGRELVRAERLGQPLALAVVDIDHFKKFNDTHGHEAGDATLKAVAETLRDSFRGDDVPCRFGGEEFVVLLPGMTAEQARERLDGVRRRLEGAAIRWAGGTIGPVTISVGVAATPGHGTSFDELFRAADAALYEAKRGGRNRAVVAMLKGSPSSPGA
jgi:diguanylate cyclase (GGDEF)-like protein